jgi:hypothetical protein
MDVGPISDPAALSIVWRAALGVLVPSTSSFDRQASATKQRPLPWSLPMLMRKTVFFFVSFQRRAMRAWILFLVSIERGTPMPDSSLPSLAVCQEPA